MNNQKTIHDPPPKIGSKVIITKNSFNKFSLGDICIRTKSGYPLNLFTVRSKEGLEQLVNWDDCQPYTELLNSKEKTMKQKTKWYNPFTWFKSEPEKEAEPTGTVEPVIEPPTVLPATSYTPPRNIPKRKPAPKKKPTAKKAKPAKKKVRK